MCQCATALKRQVTADGGSPKHQRIGITQADVIAGNHAHRASEIVCRRIKRNVVGTRCNACGAGNSQRASLRERTTRLQRQITSDSGGTKRKGIGVTQADIVAGNHAHRTGEIVGRRIEGDVVGTRCNARGAGNSQRASLCQCATALKRQVTADGGSPKHQRIGITQADVIAGNHAHRASEIVCRRIKRNVVGTRCNACGAGNSQRASLRERTTRLQRQITSDSGGAKRKGIGVVQANICARTADSTSEVVT